MNGDGGEGIRGENFKITISHSSVRAALTLNFLIYLGLYYKLIGLLFFFPVLIPQNFTFVEDSINLTVWSFQ